MGRARAGWPAWICDKSFAGLIVFNLFSECLSRAPSLVLSNPNYVKKVVFPLEVLGSVAVGSASFHALSSVIVLIVFELIAFRGIPITLLWLPLVWIPLLLGSLACTWLLAATGVFLRDIGQLVGVALNMLMFMSPIFFPTSALPTRWQPLLGLNPIAQVIEQTRRVSIHGQNPQFGSVFIGLIMSTIACELAFRLFERSKRAFADVL